MLQHPPASAAVAMEKIQIQSEVQITAAVS